MACWLLAGPGCGRLGYTTLAELAEAGVNSDGPPVDRIVGGDSPAAFDAATAADTMPDRPPDLASDVASDGPGSGTDAPDALPDALPDACVSCPASSLTLMHTSVTPVRGMAVGAQLVDSCLMTGVLIGFEGTQARNQNYPWLQSAAGICGIVTVTGSGSAATVSITEAARLATLGNTNGSPWVRRCPTNQVLVGFEGTAAGWMGTIGFRCASMLPAADGSFTVGPVTTLPIAGAPSGSPFPTTDCPAGEVAVGEQLQSSTWLDGFGLICGKFVRKQP